MRLGSENGRCFLLLVNGVLHDRNDVTRRDNCPDRLIGKDIIPRQRVHLGHDADRTLDRHGTQQAEQHHRPQRIGKYLRRALQTQSRKQNDRNHKTGGTAHIENFQKNQIKHRTSHLRISAIMRSSAAISSSDNFFFRLKAARKAGSDPEKDSSTNCSLCAA